MNLNSAVLPDSPATSVTLSALAYARLRMPEPAPAPEPVPAPALLNRAAAFRTAAYFTGFVSSTATCFCGLGLGAVITADPLANTMFAVGGIVMLAYFVDVFSRMRSEDNQQR